MSITVYIAMWGWIPVTLLLFSVWPQRRAILAALVTGWLFLPVASFSIPILPNYGKMAAVTESLLLGILIFDAQRLSSFRFRWFDAPMFVWCTMPILTSLSNGMGVWNGLSAVTGNIINWGIPYLIGRLYFRDHTAFRDIAWAMFIGGIVYAPLCLYEIRMSPQLHQLVYGFHQHVFAQARRDGGWRPMVFLQTGLAVGLWMAATSLVGMWLWRSGQVKRFLGMPIAMSVMLLIVVTILCKSYGAILLMFAGLMLMFMCRQTKSMLPIAAAAAWIPIYLWIKIVFQWHAEIIVHTIAQFNPVRAQSLAGRIQANIILVNRALEHPLLGWGGYNRFRNQTVLPDSLWSITLGHYGLLGLASLYTAMLLPTTLLIIRMRRERLSANDLPMAACMALVVVIFMYDCLSNAMLNPVYVVAAGGLIGFIPVRQTGRFPSTVMTENTTKIAHAY